MMVNLSRNTKLNFFEPQSDAGPRPPQGFNVLGGRGNRMVFEGIFQRRTGKPFQASTHPLGNRTTSTGMVERLTTSLAVLPMSASVMAP